MTTRFSFKRGLAASGVPGYSVYLQGLYLGTVARKHGRGRCWLCFTPKNTGDMADDFEASREDVAELLAHRMSGGAA